MIPTKLLSRNQWPETHSACRKGQGYRRWIGQTFAEREIVHPSKSVNEAFCQWETSTNDATARPGPRRVYQDFSACSYDGLTICIEIVRKSLIYRPPKFSGIVITYTDQLADVVAREKLC